jgi:hypothetical protein
MKKGIFSHGNETENSMAAAAACKTLTVSFSVPARSSLCCHGGAVIEISILEARKSEKCLIS